MLENGTVFEKLDHRFLLFPFNLSQCLLVAFFIHYSQETWCCALHSCSSGSAVDESQFSKAVSCLVLKDLREVFVAIIRE